MRDIAFPGRAGDDVVLPHPASTNAGNMSLGLLTCLIGAAFFAALIGLAGSIARR